MPMGSMIAAAVYSGPTSIAAIAAPARSPAMRARRTRDVGVLKVLEVEEVARRLVGLNGRVRFLDFRSSFRHGSFTRNASSLRFTSATRGWRSGSASFQSATNLV